MSVKRNFSALLLKLSQDQKLRAAIESLRRRTTHPAGGPHRFESLPEAALQIALLAGRFIGRKRARTVADVVDVITFLVSLSLLVKQNVFDRPEVRAFLKKTWGDVSTQSERLFILTRQQVKKRLEQIRNKMSGNP
ncbi:MAG: hypothetical protein AB7G93_05455 [Bdellovibrionales bacterium]